MSRSHRFLGGVDSIPVTTQTNTTPPEPINKDSDFVVILAALLCALICVLGLVAVAIGRCAWIRRLSTRSSPSNSLGNKGLKKKIIHALPKLSFKEELSSKYSECPICLGEFCVGEEIRVLPHCGHGFHVKCIDTWLGSHSTCPSCRQILVVNRCKKCGGGGGGFSGASFDAINEARLDELNRYLP